MTTADCHEEKYSLPPPCSFCRLRLYLDRIRIFHLPAFPAFFAVLAADHPAKLSAHQIDLSMHDSRSPGSSVKSDTAKGPHVLVVEDNRDLAKLFCDLLEIVGCTTEIAGTVSAGIEQAKGRMPQLVFCDLMLPGEKSGFEFPRELRTLTDAGNVRLIAVTGYSNPEDHARALEAGFEHVMTKPVKFAEVQNVVSSVHRGA